MEDNTSKELKTKPYVRRALNNYQAKFDRMNLNLPKGSAEKIRQATGMSVNAYVNKLIKEDMFNSFGIDI